MSDENVETQAPPPQEPPPEESPPEEPPEEIHLPGEQEPQPVTPLEDHVRPPSIDDAGNDRREDPSYRDYVEVPPTEEPA